MPALVVFAPFLAGHTEEIYLRQLIVDLESGDIDARIDAISNAIRGRSLTDDVIEYL